MSIPIQEIKQQHPILGYSHLIMQEAGLRVEEKRFFNRTEFVIPYEDLMPLDVARFHNFPFRLTLAALFVFFGCSKATYTIITQAGQRESALWLLLILSGVLLGVIAQALRLWKHEFILTTGRGNIMLFDSRRNRKALYAFANALRDHTILYLRNQYGKVDPLLPVEPQLARFEWLRNLGVLNDTQFQQLKNSLSVGLSKPGDWPDLRYGPSPSIN
jgi:hypothetical protein